MFFAVEKAFCEKGKEKICMALPAALKNKQNVDFSPTPGKRSSFYTPNVSKPATFVCVHPPWGKQIEIGKRMWLQTTVWHSSQPDKRPVEEYPS